MVKSRVKTAKITSAHIKVAGSGPAGRSIQASSDWKRIKDLPGEFQGIQVFYPVDPYTPNERKEFRSAVSNPYVYRACRIVTTFTVGQGYTTSIVPRIEEELTDDDMEVFKQQTTYVPYWDEEMTFDELKDRIDKMATEMDLADNVFNAYFTSLEQGRCVLALTPLDADEENGKYPLPKMIRYIRPEFTLRPILDANTSELIGCYVIGSRSKQTPSAIDSRRMIYITHAFNNELFSDYYGDSKIARIADVANNLNLVLNQDTERAAEHTWHQPKVWSIPIPPQEVGNEEAILAEFLTTNNQNAKGRDIAVASTAMKDEKGVELLSATTNSGDIGGLDVIRTMLIKGIITAFGLPGFMLSEGDIGRLGGNANIEEIDMFLNTEVRPERLKIEAILEKQFYDPILCTLYDIDDPEDLPVKIKHKYNKPTLLTLLPPEMISSLQALVQNGWIEPSAVTEILHLEQYKKETVTKGNDADPARQQAEWNKDWGVMPKGWAPENGWTKPGSSWDSKKVDWQNGTEQNRWGKTPLGAWAYPSRKWSKGTLIDKKQEGQFT